MQYKAVILPAFAAVNVILVGNSVLNAVICSSGTCCQIRMHAIPQPKQVDRWNEKRSMFGVYDNIGILGKGLE